MLNPENIIRSLANTPFILNHLINLIPAERYQQRLVTGKWTIHEQVCHLVDAQSILSERFELFSQSDNPNIMAHEPDSGPLSENEHATGSG